MCGCIYMGGKFWLKMVKCKDMYSSSPARTPKLQPAVEQPLTGRHWNPSKRYPMSKGKGEVSIRC